MGERRGARCDGVRHSMVRSDLAHRRCGGRSVVSRIRRKHEMRKRIIHSDLKRSWGPECGSLPFELRPGNALRRTPSPPRPLQLSASGTFGPAGNGIHATSCACNWFQSHKVRYGGVDDRTSSQVLSRTTNGRVRNLRTCPPPHHVKLSSIRLFDGRRHRGGVQQPAVA